MTYLSPPAPKTCLIFGVSSPNLAPNSLPKSSVASTIKASMSICFVLTSTSAINFEIKSSSGFVALIIKELSLLSMVICTAFPSEASPSDVPELITLNISLLTSLASV